MNNAPHTICLIDDDKIYQMITTRIIELVNPNQKVIVFNNGQQAIDFFEGNEEALPDVIFLDINMPVMNGWEFLDAFTNMPVKKVPVYMVSSSVNCDDAIRSQRYDVVKDFIIKPICRHRISEILAAAFDKQKTAAFAQNIYPVRSSPTA